MSKYKYESGQTRTNNHKSLTSIALGALALLAVGSADAYLTFSGIDNNGNLAVQVAPTNSSAARTSFLNNLTGVGTENFEAQAGSAPLVLNFGVAGTATLSGGGLVATNPAGGTNGAGRYSVPGGTRYWETSAGGTGNFAVDFSVPEAAFGFFGIDLGDFGGTLTLQMLNGVTQVGSIVVPQAALAVADGSILYFGLIAQNAGEQFNHVNFLTTVGTGDVFAFDSFTIGTQQQVVPMPEPATLALIATSLLGLGLSRRRRS